MITDTDILIIKIFILYSIGFGITLWRMMKGREI